MTISSFVYNHPGCLTNENCGTRTERWNLLVSTFTSILNDIDIYFSRMFARRDSHPLLTDLVDNLSALSAFLLQKKMCAYDKYTKRAELGVKS